LLGCPKRLEGNYDQDVRHGVSLGGVYHDAVFTREEGEDLVRLALAAHHIVAGLDEVGRGALAGPLVVGVTTLATWSSPPTGLTDSKLLSARRREALCGPLIEWVLEWSLGTASAGEVDEHGVRGALNLASRRALSRLHQPPGIVIIDGPLNLLEDDPVESSSGADVPPVECVVSGDRVVPLISAASVLAKVCRDRAMDRLGAPFPDYGWAANRGYGTEAHRNVLRTHGATPFHRQSWNLGLDDASC
jgi:ribonuclease HII